MSSAWVDIQEKTFTRWVNEWLKMRGLHAEKLDKDFCNGINFINLVEVISGKSLGRYNRNPRVPTQKHENNCIALDFLKTEGIKLVNIGAEDLTDGRLKLQLGLIWTLILRYQINLGGGGEGDGAKNELLEWVRSKIPEYNIQNFRKDWNDGRALCALNNALVPGSCPGHRELDPNNKEANCQRGCDLGLQHLSVPIILEPKDMTHAQVDEHSVMAYISYYRNAQPREIDWASQFSAYGPGLVQGVQGEESDFKIVGPKGAPGKIDVKVIGPKNNAEVLLRTNPDGSYDVKYSPTEPGEWQVHVTLDGKHIPGSIFMVRVLEQVSLGGEGKIRVYYSTTSSSNKGRADVVSLQRLLETKAIHKRPDFEPWIPVDVLDRNDREAVYKKAGTRALPIVYVDDSYAGDADTMQALEESGKLDALLNVANWKKHQF